MSEVMVTMIAALAGELLLVLFVLLAVAWFRSRAAQRRDNKAMRVLVARIKNGKKEREATMAGFLGEQMGLSGEPLQQAKTAILRAELVLLQRFAGVYKKRDAGAAAQFDIDLAAAVLPYQELQSGGTAVAPDEPAVDASELEKLRAENVRLSEELSVTMETMSRMLNEYSTMFAGGAGGVVAPVAALAGAAGAAAAGAGAGEGVAPRLETGPAAPLSDAGFENDADIDIVAETDIGAEDDPGAQYDVEVDFAPDDDFGAAADGSDDIVGADDALVEGYDTEEVVAGDQADADADVTGQDDIDVLFAAENDDSLFDESVQDAVIESPLDEPDNARASQELRSGTETTDTSDPGPEPVSDVKAAGGEHEEAAGFGDGDIVESGVVVDVQEEAPGDAPEEVSAGAAAGAPQTSGEARGYMQDTEITTDQGELVAAADGELLEVEIEAGDDLEAVTGLLEEGPAEVVAFEDAGDFDVALAVDGDDLFDAAGSETIVRAEAAAGDVIDSAGNGEEPDIDELFDAIEQPLKTRIVQ
jgi:hypothetical protein